MQPESVPYWKPKALEKAKEMEVKLPPMFASPEQKAEWKAFSLTFLLHRYIVYMLFAHWEEAALMGDRHCTVNFRWNINVWNRLQQHTQGKGEMTSCCGTSHERKRLKGKYLENCSHFSIYRVQRMAWQLFISEADIGSWHLKSPLL